MSAEDANTKKDYEVGYGKPPKSGQFKKGQSGNRRGSSEKARARAAKKSSFGDLFSDGMQQPVEIEENGRTITLTRLHLAIRRRVEEAAKGKMAPLKELLKLGDMPDQGPLAPVKRLILTIDEAMACALPLEEIFYRPNTVLVREEKPSADGEPRKRRRRKEEPNLPRRSARELIELELERQIQVTDRATGTARRMTMREVIAEQLMRQFTAGKAGAADLIIKLNKFADIDLAERHKVYIGIPWDYELPPRPEQGADIRKSGSDVAHG